MLGKKRRADIESTDEGAFSIVSLFLFKSFLVQTVHLLIEVNKIC